MTLCQNFATQTFRKRTAQTSSSFDHVVEPHKENINLKRMIFYYTGNV